MPVFSDVRRFTAAALLGLLAASSILSAQPASPAAPPLAAPAATEPPSQTMSMGDLSKQVWSDVRGDKESELRSLLQSVQVLGGGEGVQRLKDSFASLDKSFQKREDDRAEKITEVEAKLAEQIAKGNDPKALSQALKFAVERFLVSKPEDRDTFMIDGRITNLVKDADAAAHKAEADSDWFLANELFVRMHLLLEEKGTYKEDVRRIGDRLAMIRLYTPERFWKLRNDERIEDKKPELPPYNGLGEDYHDRLAGVEMTTVSQAVFQAARQQIDQVPLKDILSAGLDSLRTMFTTTDIQGAFPGLKDEKARTAMMAFLDREFEKVGAMGQAENAAPRATLKALMEETLAANATTVKVLDEAVMHEFGNGCMSRMDEFSAIIWPDEVERFRRMTEGQFKGVGIQIQMDDESQKIKVVTPLEGTPAQRAGIKSGDLITKINGDSAVGISLNQAVDLITGPENTDVTVTVERTVKGGEGAEDKTTEIDFPLKRAVIPVSTVKGWKRLGAREDDWEWFIDRPNHIGYVRLLQFTDETTRDLHKAIESMKHDGLSAMILDLRFNPGGLLNEAVSVANTFIDNGTIVSTRGTVPGEVRTATKPALLKGIPVAVLINEGSASASEIVSGAIRHYADNGTIDAILIGERSYGKGSVQNVWPLSPNTMMKLTTQYYYLPDGRTIHRRPGDSKWGVDPHMSVQMLPEQVSEALKIRQDADVLTIDEKGQVVEGTEPHPQPEKLLTDSIDVQLQTALVILQIETVAREAGHARVNN